jgi:hypothetical protein
LTPWAAGFFRWKAIAQTSRSASCRTLDKILDRGRHVSKLQVASAPQLVSNVLGDIFRPSFRGVERDHAHRIAKLTFHKASDGCF